MLTDSFDRRFSYLRLSVTEVCNFRCDYCLPDGTDCGAEARAQDLTLDEIRRLVAAFAKLGTRKVRITGGEPSLRKDLVDIIRICKATPGIETVALTTNGYRLAKDIDAWHEAGLDALNVSIDSLDHAKFELITGHNKLQQILQGLARAAELGINNIKVNAVLMKHYNDDAMDDFFDFVKARPITLRLIELMRTGDNEAFFNRHHLSGQAIINQLKANHWQERLPGTHAGPAREFWHPDYSGGIGLIMPYSKDFCNTCNRLRVSSQGALFLCLFVDQHQSLRHLLQSDDSQPVMDFLQQAIKGKTISHNLHQQNPGSTRQLAMIGG
ncbi:GTP 3',8-cyclase MoaA [Gilvimarinus polysaccharolyticus]|uniref:GTP 3',8-cyclase MoaA n=1 Tax=Gilvimarinus polysaccharolyticus TaxID=863921 RepID=UPI000673BED2|nr:GTP 3',8-cyclase MoaA [Gilvimarinus polysaccharolyticus]